jgi:hypothetical protein
VSETWPAVWHRQRSTAKPVTGVTQSAPSRNEASVSPIPKPSGLTTPAAITATRAALGGRVEEEKSGIF